MCEPNVTIVFAGAFAESPVAWALAPLIATLRLWGLAVLVLVVAALSQLVAGTAVGVWGAAAAVAGAADPPGFGAVVAHFENVLAGSGRSDSAAGLKFFSAFSRVLLENCVQLWLQSSFFGVMFNSLDWAAKGKVLASLALGLLGATYKSVVAIKAGHAGALPSFLTLGMVWWSLMKIYFVFQCDSHMWNLTSGCVHFSAGDPVTADLK